MDSATYEMMKQAVVAFSFGGWIGLILGTIINGLFTFVQWIVKKVRQHREKKLTTEQTGEKE